MPDMSPAMASPRLTRWNKVVRWLDDQGLDLYHVATLAIIILVIMAFYIYFGLLMSGDEDTRGTNRTPKMDQD